MGKHDIPDNTTQQHEKKGRSQTAQPNSPGPQNQVAWHVEFLSLEIDGNWLCGFRNRILRKIPIIFALILFSSGLFGCDGKESPGDSSSSKTSSTPTAPVPKNPRYLGSATCQPCHQTEYRQWTRSHHHGAMQSATPDTVLGDFENRSVEYFGVRTTFFKKNETFVVRTDGADGELADFEISHTFGVHPLQQYLISFPDGRLQALGIAWDTRSEAEGGQKWFHLYPDEPIPHTDPLHWTGRNQTWNYMCADCHSTNLKKHYDLENDRYQTTWSDMNVGCESCHGPSSKHVTWANTSTSGSNPPYSTSNKTGMTVLATAPEEINTCAKCHSRRSILSEGSLPGKSFLDYYLPALLDPSLYYSDGQILDEVYVYGSFLQSKMHHRGVRCTDCHNPHSGQLPKPGNATCTACHQPEPPSRFPSLKGKRYDSSQHHFHPNESPGSQCKACHMPTKLFMVVDERHDHSFRIPRPDLSLELGVPNACNACHAKQSVEWAANQLAKWYPTQPKEHFSTNFDAGRRGELHAEKFLSELSLIQNKPDMIRATALSLLGRYNRTFSREAIEKGLREPQPLIRLGALRGAERLLPPARWQSTQHLLTDPHRAIRIEAGRLLAPVDPTSLNSEQRQYLKGAISEYIAAQMVNADRPEAHTNIGVIYSQSRKFSKAEQAYTQALVLDPNWIPALVNLADLYRALGRDAEGEPLLTRALDSEPNNPSLHHAFGLWLTRQGKPDESLKSLKRAAHLDPETARYAYVYGIALNSTGRPLEAVKILRKALIQFPENLDVLYALVTIHRDQGEMKEAVGYAKKLEALRPDQEYFHQLVQELRQKQKAQ